MDDADDNELVCLYEKENPVIEVGKLWPSMDEFRMSFRTYAVKKSLMPRQCALIGRNFMLAAKVLMVVSILVNGTYLPDYNLMEVQ